MLFEAGGDACDGETVYHASDEGHAACLEVIERYTNAERLAEECTSCLRIQLHWKRTRGLEWLLQHGADPNAGDAETGNTALHEAARQGSRDAVLQRLMDAGASAAKKNKTRQTPLDLAEEAGHVRVAQQLRAHVGKRAGSRAE